MTQAVQPDFEGLLTHVGAHPPWRGHGKWGCPDCHRPTLSVNSDKQVFNCHHAGCEFHGGIGTLRKRLGIRREWLPDDEYRELCEKRERALDAAQRLHGAVQASRKALLGRLHDLNRLETSSHESGPSEVTWEALQMVDGKRPGILAELTVLEDATAADLVRFFLAGSEIRRQKIRRVLESRGFCPRAGEFIEVQP